MIRWNNSLQPKKYEIAGTSPDSRILFLNVNIIESTGKEPYIGNVLIEGQRFAKVGTVQDLESLKNQNGVCVFNGRGRTLMSDLGDGHAHFSWNGGDLDQLGTLAVEKHTLLSMRSARCFLHSGYTMCFGAASAKERLDIVIRDAINAGDISGSRCLANGKEMARRGDELAGGITAFADGPEEMQKITEKHSAQDCYFTDEEMAAYVDEAHKHGKRFCAHSRARDSLIMYVKHGVEVFYHASYIDTKGMDMLEKEKSKHVIVPAINWLICTLYDAEAFGYPQAAAKKAGYKQELEVALAGLREMHRRGIVVLPGGDHGFAWTPHGTYARDLEHFVKLLGFTEHEAVIAATAGVAAQFMQSHELGKILPGYYADCILVDGDPLKDIAVLQDHSKLNIICINGT